MLNSYRLLKKHKLSQQDVSQVFSKNECFHGKNLFFIYKPNQLGYPRIHAIIAKKKSKSAVQRNLIRRLIKEQFRRQQYDLNSIDIIVLANKRTKFADKDAFNRCLENFFEPLTK